MPILYHVPCPRTELETSVVRAVLLVFLDPECSLMVNSKPLTLFTTPGSVPATYAGICTRAKGLLRSIPIDTLNLCGSDTFVSAGSNTFEP